MILVLLYALAAAAPTAPRPAPLKLEIPRAGATHGAAETKCGLCHTVEGWQVAKFPHEKTGFPLLGAHQRAPCRACHPGDFNDPTKRVCSACHLDAHQGELGVRCASCHDEESWRSRFTADAHRRTAFPLSGRHAFIPCEECHADLRDRTFGRNALECVACHQKDYDRTAGRSLDHAAAGFDTACRDCHDPWRFAPARFPRHEACFQIQGGPHAGTSCLGCHTSLPASAPGTCSTNTAACTRCHAHACASTDGRHREVPGYQCKDRKCYECHRFVSGR